MTRINAKHPVLMTSRLAAIFDKLSKSDLADLCVDLIRRTEGADANEWDICRTLAEDYLPPVLRERKSKMPNCAAIYFAGASILKAIADHGSHPSTFKIASLVAEGLLEVNGKTLTDAGREVLRQLAESKTETAGG